MNYYNEVHAMILELKIIIIL